MFKKQFKVSNSHALANKDKKKLREQLIRQQFDGPSIEAFLEGSVDSQGDLFQDKLQGSKVAILSRGKTPLMFTIDTKQATLYLPSLYMLFQLPQLVPLRVTLKQGVEHFIFNGADLMWPGIASISSDDFKQYDIVVVATSEGITIAVGRMLTNKVPEELKGKAVQVEHYLYDELWNSGTKKIPEGVVLPKQEEPQEQEGQTVQPQDLVAFKESQVEEGKVGVTGYDDEKKECVLEEEEEEKGSVITPEETNKEENGAASGGVSVEEAKVSQEEMDGHLVEAFYRSLHESVKDSDLPMEPSDFQKDHLNLYSAIEYKLDFRLSSFKRVGKLLELMHKKGVIDYSEPKGKGHKVIVRVIRDNEEFKNYVPKYSLRKAKGTAEKGVVKQDQLASELGYPKVQIEEVYETTKHLSEVIRQVKDHQVKSFYSLKECRDLLSAYVTQNQLDQRRGMIKLDPVIAQLISANQKNSEGEVTKDVLLKSVQNHVKECHQITQMDEQEIIKSRVKVVKGPVPHVLVKAQKVSNKKQTVITGLEIFQIDYEELVPSLSTKCAGSATLHEVEGKKGMTVQVQGEHIDTIVDMLTKKYQVPMKYIDTENTIASKKGGKK